MRRILSDALGRQGFDVVATAADGDEALAACNEHRPDALTLDLHMPGLDGLGVLRALRAGKAEPVPVVVVSAFSPAHGARAVDALAEGAFDLVAKPAMGESMADFTTELSKKVNDAAVSGKLRARRRAWSPPRSRRSRPSRRARRVRSATRKFVLIASSTGGPKALGELIPKLPSPLGTGLDDRPAHAGRLHRLAGHAPRRRLEADRPRGGRRRDDGPASHVPRPRRSASAHGRRPQGAAVRRRPARRPAPACGLHDRRRRQALRQRARCSSS